MANTIKKENEVTKVTTLGDTDYVRVTLANGQSGSIKKNDLMPIIKDEIGKLLGNADPLSTFTNVLVNNGQTLGKATIENLASVVSGANVQTWNIDTDLSLVNPGNYLVSIQHSKIDNSDIGEGVGLSINVAGYGLQIIQTQLVSKRRFSIGRYYYPWANW